MDRLIDFFLSFYGTTPYWIVFLILFGCGLGLPIPEDITLFAAATISYYGIADVHWMCLISFVGILFGDTVIFYLGSKYGHRLTTVWPFSKFLKPDRLTVVTEKFHKYGNKLIFAARFMPGLRAPIFFTSGLLKLPFRVFFFYDCLAALLSVPAIVYSVFYFGDEIDQVVRGIKKVEHVIVLTICAFVIIFLVKKVRARKKNDKTI